MNEICIYGKLSITDNKLHCCHRDGWDGIQSLNPTTSQKPPSVASELSPARMSVPRTLQARDLSELLPEAQCKAGWQDSGLATWVTKDLKHLQKITKVFNLKKMLCLDPAARSVKTCCCFFRHRMQAYLKGMHHQFSSKNDVLLQGTDSKPQQSQSCSPVTARTLWFEWR